MARKKVSTFGKRLQSLLSKHNLSQSELANVTGIRASSISDWKNEKYEAKQDKIDLIATYFNVSPAWLMGYDVPMVRQNEYSNLIPLERSRRIPILGYTYCGTFSWSEENFEGYFLADKLIEADYCLIAKGDSMIEANILDGDIVFLKHTSTVDNGKIAVVRIGDEVTLKKVIKMKDKIILQPYNASYEPIVLEDEPEARIVGELVGVYHKVG